MSQENERSKSHKEEKKADQTNSKTSQVNPGEDLMRSEEKGASERMDSNETPDRKGETQNVDDEGKDNDEDVD